MAARKFLGSILIHADMQYEALREFDLAMVGAEFIFDKNIVKYIGNLRKMAVEAKFAQISMANLANSKRQEHIENSHAAILWLHDQFQQLERTFAPYISIKKRA